MKNFKYYLMALASIAMLNACSDDDPVPRQPRQWTFQAEPSSALFGDSLPFTIKASDADVPLSTLKAQLYFSDEMVSENCNPYQKLADKSITGKIYVPLSGKHSQRNSYTEVLSCRTSNFTIQKKSYERGAESSGLPLPDS